MQRSISWWAASLEILALSGEPPGLHAGLKVTAAILFDFRARNARPQGISTIDTARLAETVQQLLKDINEITNQVQQIT